jgi:hypothetical protein
MVSIFSFSKTKYRGEFLVRVAVAATLLLAMSCTWESDKDTDAHLKDTALLLKAPQYNQTIRMDQLALEKQRERDIDTSKFQRKPRPIIGE